MDVRVRIPFGLWVTLAGLLWVDAAALAAAPADQKSGVLTFQGDAPAVARRDPHIPYDLNVSQERYFVFTPAAYTGQEPYGLIVYTSPAEQVTELPAGWKPILERRKLLFVAAQKAGNDQPDARRFGLAVLGAGMAKQLYKIDPQRIYAAGFSGGARIAGKLGFYQPEIFRGTIQACGADFYQDVPPAHPVPQQVAAQGKYGLMTATEEEIAQAKQNVRFVLITGSNDFRYANIRNIFEGGFAKAGFKAKLIDVAGLSHEDCRPKTLNDALDFIEPRPASAPATTAPATTKPVVKRMIAE